MVRLAVPGRCVQPRGRSYGHEPSLSSMKKLVRDVRGMSRVRIRWEAECRIRRGEACLAPPDTTLGIVRFLIVETGLGM